MKDPDKKRLISYFVLSFAISWGLWSPFYFSDNVSEFWLLPGAWGPTLAAIILTGKNEGRSGIRKLLRKLLIWKVPVQYYLFAIFGMLGIGVLAILLHISFGGNAPDTGMILQGMGLSEGDTSLAIMLFPLFFLINTFMGGPVAEELGWRGYAQPLFQQIHGPVKAGLAIGLLWSLWHIPLMIFASKAVGGIPVVFYIPMVTAFGLLFSWLYNKTRGSVLLAILFHGGINFSTGFLGASVFKDQILLGIYVILIILLALILGKRLTVDG